MAERLGRTLEELRRTMSSPEWTLWVQRENRRAQIAEVDGGR